MAINGFFLGGAAEGMQNYADTALKARALDIQSAQLVGDQQKALLAQADDAIGKTMTIIGDTVKGVASNPNLANGIDAYASAIANVESGGDYNLKGPVTKDGDRAYGKYQVMGANVPVWTKEVLGTAMTPEQFVASPQAQDKVFAAKFGQAVQQYGNADDAASVWFSGKPLKEAASISDQLGTTGAEYVQKFNEALSGYPRQKVKAVIAPLLKDVTDIAGKVGKNPQMYVDQVDALVNAAPVGVEAGIQAGKIEAAKKIGEVNGLIRAGISSADAELTAGIKAAGDGGLTPDQRVSAEGSLQSRFLGLSKQFIDVRDNYNVARASTATPAGDIALVNAYMKMVDPGSIVHEGEFATVQNAAGVPDQLRNLWNQLLTGGRIGDKQRQDLLDQADKIYAARAKAQQYTADQFRAIAKRTGLNADNVVVDISAAPGTTTAAPAAGGNSSPTPKMPPPVGTIQGGYKFTGGDPANQSNWVKLP